VQGLEKGVLFLDIMIFILSLCAVAVGVLLSHLIERRHAVLKQQDA
jgi:hypothetical protein